MAPSDLGDVDESFESVERHEETELHDAAHDAVLLVATLQVFQSFRALLGQRFAFRDDDLSCFLIHGDDFDGEGMPDELLKS